MSLRKHLIPALVLSIVLTSSGCLGTLLTIGAGWYIGTHTGGGGGGDDQGEVTTPQVDLDPVPVASRGQEFKFVK